MSLLTSAELAASAESIAVLQTPEGLILWTPTGHADPWNHVETAMALDEAGRHEEATRAYKWLKDNQLSDGSWHQYYTATGVEDAKFDANTIAYIATGVWHHYLITDDRAWLEQQWNMVEAAIDWVLELQQPTGEIFWAREPDGTQFHYALITGSSSIHHSIGSAISIGRTLEQDTEVWEASQDLLHHALSEHPLEFFAEKDRWAMDWYYPIIGGIASGAAADQRLQAKWNDFVIEGFGVKCVNDHPWVTTGETAEAAIAFVLADRTDVAIQLLEWTRALRFDDGSYWTGLHVPSATFYPEGERTAYSAAAMILAHAMLDPTSATARTFRPAS